MTMISAKKDPNQNVDPIASTDTTKRLDAIVRRHGGKPKPVPGKVSHHLPEPKRGECKGQRKLW